MSKATFSENNQIASASHNQKFTARVALNELLINIGFVKPLPLHTVKGPFPVMHVVFGTFSSTWLVDRKCIKKVISFRFTRNENLIYSAITYFIVLLITGAKFVGPGKKNYLGSEKRIFGYVWNSAIT